MRWMEIAWQQEGSSVAEIGGPRANATIVGYFHGIGRTDVTSDEVPWCAAAVFYCLQRGGVPIKHIPINDRLLAVSVRKIGRRIAGPRPGAVYLRGRPGGHHTGFVVSWTATTIKILGGNQSDSFCADDFKRQPGEEFYWPQTVSADEIGATSRIATAAQQQQKDAVKATGTQVAPQFTAPSDAALPQGSFPDAGALADQATGLQYFAEQALSFSAFAAKQWPWLILILALYWGARILWNGWRIRGWRIEDALTGKTGAGSRQPASGPLSAAGCPMPDAELEVADGEVA